MIRPKDSVLCGRASHETSAASWLFDEVYRAHWVLLLPGIATAQWRTVCGEGSTVIDSYEGPASAILRKKECYTLMLEWPKVFDNVRVAQRAWCSGAGPGWVEEDNIDTSVFRLLLRASTIASRHHQGDTQPPMHHAIVRCYPK